MTKFYSHVDAISPPLTSNSKYVKSKPDFSPGHLAMHVIIPSELRIGFEEFGQASTTHVVTIDNNISSKGFNSKRIEICSYSLSKHKL